MKGAASAPAARAQRVRLKRTPERLEAVLSHLRIGASRSHACAMCDVSETTRKEWQRDPAVAAAFARAEAEHAASLVASVDSAGGKDWKARAWLLERRHREQWGRLDGDATIETPDGTVIRIVMAQPRERLGDEG